MESMRNEMRHRDLAVLRGDFGQREQGTALMEYIAWSSALTLLVTLTRQHDARIRNQSAPQAPGRV